MNAVEIRGLTFTYHDGTRALQQLDLTVKKNKKTVILGSNGSGKTTLIYHFNGTFLPQEGEVRVLGLPVKKENLGEVRKKVGLLFDNPDNQLFSTSVYHDVAFGPRNLGLGEEEVRARVNRVLNLVDLGELKSRPPYNLSLGQKKKAAIAGLLAMEPEILVCDEPFSGLDPYSARQFLDILDNLAAGGATLVLSAHDVNLAYAWADEVVILKDGQLLERGEAALLQGRELMEEARLAVPLLAETFSGTGYYPRTAREAGGLFQGNRGMLRGDKNK